MREYGAYRYFGGFRCLLAVLVVLQHFLANLAPEPLASASLPYGFGSVAVTVFFALSGFVISEAAEEVYRRRPLAFLINRALRIVPHYLLAVAIAMLLSYYFEALGTLRIARHEHFDAQTAFTARNVALNLLGFLPGSERLIDYNFLVPGWALRVETLFYVLMAAAMALAATAERLRGPALGAPGVGLGMAILIAPLAVLAALGKAPAMLQFAPYFVYGAALYQMARKPSRVAALVAATALAGSLLQFAMQPSHNATLGFERAVGAEFAMLVLLLAAMTGLAFARCSRFEHTDRRLGDLTYALYVSHPNVGILVLSMTVGYSYLGLVGGLALSLIVTLLSRALLDPAVDHMRDAIRGGRLDRAGAREPAGRRSTDRVAHERFGVKDDAEHRAA